MTKVQLTLTDQEAALLTKYGSQLGYSLAKTAKFIVSKASEQILTQGQVPVYTMSPETETKGIKAKAAHKAGKTTPVDDPDRFFADL